MRSPLIELVDGIIHHQTAHFAIHGKLTGPIILVMSCTHFVSTVSHTPDQCFQTHKQGVLTLANAYSLCNAHLERMVHTYWKSAFLYAQTPVNSPHLPNNSFKGTCFPKRSRSVSTCTNCKQIAASLTGTFTFTSLQPYQPYRDWERETKLFLFGWT